MKPRFYVYQILIFTIASFFTAVWSDCLAQAGGVHQKHAPVSIDEVEHDEPKNLELQESERPNLFEEAQKKALRWRFETGDILEISKESSQSIEINDKSGHDILTRYVLHYINLENTGKDPYRGYRFNGTFRSQFRYENIKNHPYQEEESFHSEFYLQPRGKIIAAEDVYMPNVRDLPLFPEDVDPATKEKIMAIGAHWENQAYEIISAKTLISIPLQVRYEYLGVQELKTGDKIKRLHKIRMNIEVNHEIGNSLELGSPKKLFGYASSIMIWDETEGIPYISRDDYNLILLFPDNSSQEFKIKSTTRYRKKKKNPETSRQIITELNDRFKNLKEELKPRLEQSSEGVKIELPEILFDHNSSRLGRLSREVLTEIARILKKHPEKRVLIRGHTDNTGSDEYNLNLSRRRAESVTRYLIRVGNLPPEVLSYEGYGSKHPIADNSTPLGRQKNRRVELIILD